MAAFSEVQEYYSGFYGLKHSLYQHVMSRSLEAFDKADRKRNKIKTKEEFLKYQQNAKKAFLKSMGRIPYDKNLPLDAKITGTTIHDGLKIENVIFQSRKGVYVTGSFYIPENATGKLPAILFQGGHAAEGRLCYAYRRVCTILAKSGLIVFGIDPVGQGERQSYPELFAPTDSPTAEHQYCGNQCVLNNEVLTKYFIADAMRGVDYLQSRPEVDADKIGATGSSGGGTMTAVMGVVDDRIKAAAPGTFITTRRDYIYSGAGQDAEQIWFGTSRDGFDHYELISCFCPKPYMILGVRSDFFCREGTEKVFKKEKEFYKLFGKEDNMRIAWDDSTHAFTPVIAKAAAEFFNEVFKGRKINAEIVEPLKDNTPLKSTKTGQLISEPGAVTPVFEANLIEFAKKTCKNPKAALLKNIYNYRKECAFNVRHIWSGDVDGMVFDRIVWFSQEYMPCYGTLFKPEDKKDEKLPVTICLWEDGTDKIEDNQQKIKDIVKCGKAALVVDLVGMGKCESYALTTYTTKHAPEKKLNHDLFFLGDSLCAMRVYDLIKAIEMVKEEYGADDISLYTEGNFNVYSEILNKIDKGVKAECVNPVSIKDIMTNKIYDDNNFINIYMPGLGIYLK